MEKTAHRIVIGDSRRMCAVADSSVQLVVTSPPYWQLKDYGSAAQIGFNDSYEDYINNLSLVWQECHRALEDGGRLCINIGDQFARAVYYGRYKVIPIKTEIIKFCEACGFDYMGAIIWQKQTTMNTSGGGSVMGSYPYPRNGIIKIDYESILILKKPGSAAPVSRRRKEASKLTQEEWNTFFCGHWHFPGERQSGHIAMFPQELPRRLIRMFSFAGDTVLDPFLGSGTTALSAMHLQRNSIGYEINADFAPLIRQKAGKGVTLTSGAQMEIAHAADSPLAAAEREARIAHLPYVFRDAVKISRKVDPKKLPFGSKLDANGSGAGDGGFYQVAQVLGADKVQLSSGATVRLLGVRPVRGKTQDAVTYIGSKTKGQKVFIKFDAEKYDEEGNLQCYLYLANKTFINAHLIKRGYAQADKRTTYKHQERFIKYQEGARPPLSPPRAA